ncbi:MAG: tRNA lysidine(34) synthetase TilS [Phycisphaerales bacterium]
MAARRHWLVAEVARCLGRRCGVAGGARVVVGVSGGADSLALLLALAAIRQRRRGPGPAIEPVAAHVNHHLRDSADEDAAFVAEVCDRLGVTLQTQHVHPARMPGNLAANARRLRYEALGRVAASADAGYVAVAHHAEDQLETLLIALCRGAGLDGLSGMAWSRPLVGPVSLIRPLLGVGRSACEDLCCTAGIQWRDDPTNVDPTTVRGRLRRDVLPVLEELWPEAASRAAGAADVVQAARTALEHQLQEAFGGPSQRCWDRTQLAALPLPIIAAGLRRAVMDEVDGAGDGLGQRHLLPVAEAIRDSDPRPRRFDWPRGLTVVVTSKQVQLRRHVPADTDPRL